MESVDQHANDAEHKRRRSESVGLVPRVSKAAYDRWEKVGDSGGDVDRGQEGHEHPHLGILDCHHETLATTDFF